MSFFVCVIDHEGGTEGYGGPFISINRRYEIVKSARPETWLQSYPHGLLERAIKMEKGQVQFNERYSLVKE